MNKGGNSMKITLSKKPQNPIIIQGFPGFGLVGTITTEFLIDHLKTEKIGRVRSEKIPAMVALHDNKLVEPMGIFYNEEYNILIFHMITNSKGIEWMLAEKMTEICNELNAKELICLEGVGNPEAQSEGKVFYFTNSDARKEAIKALGLEDLKEGIIIGPTASMLLSSEKTPVTCFFSETHSNLPDSKSAAKLIETLDKYLNIKVDYGPLLEQAAKFETKLKSIMEQTQNVEAEKAKKDLNYFG